MKFKPNVPEPGQKRTIKKFLFLPKTLRVKDRSGLMLRWLEFAEIEQRGIHGTWKSQCWGDI